MLLVGVNLELQLYSYRVSLSLRFYNYTQMEGKQYIKVLEVISMQHISSVFPVKREEHISRLKYGSVAVPEKLNSRFSLTILQKQ